MNYKDWIATKSKEDIEWLLREFKTLTKAYQNYIVEYYKENTKGNK